MTAARFRFPSCALLLLLCFLSCTAAAAPPRGFVGVNCAIWDSQLDTSRTAALLSYAGVTALRWPGGSTSDTYDWTSAQGTTTAQFADLAQRLHAVVTVTTNYGSGSPQMAAAWVAYCNASLSNRTVIGHDAKGRDWNTASYWAAVRAATPLPYDDGLNRLRAGRPAPFAFQNWEIGNECYGLWENDNHVPKHDAVEYAQFATTAARLMRSVDPNIRIGIVVTGPDRPFFCQESVHDKVSSAVSSEWTPVVLSALSAHGMRPDFVSLHHYPQDSGKESDAALFADPQTWPALIQSLRKELSAYYLKLPGRAEVGIQCNECNSVAFNPGPQTTGEANARYYSLIAPIALSLGLENFVWWDLRNAPNRSGHDTHSQLNRYPYGDYGILGSRDQPYPAYYAIQRFGKGK